MLSQSIRVVSYAMRFQLWLGTTTSVQQTWLYFSAVPDAEEIRPAHYKRLDLLRGEVLQTILPVIAATQPISVYLPHSCFFYFQYSDFLWLIFLLLAVSRSFFWDELCPKPGSELQRPRKKHNPAKLIGASIC